MKSFVGTMGYSFDDWKGTFYPADIKSGDMLSYYAKHYNAVEMNSTFYRMPKTETFLSWAEAVPRHFKFVVKASRRITHFSRLKNTRGSSVDYLVKMASNLGSRLGPLLFQLPPSFKKDLDRLAEFLPEIPDSVDAVFEFRHESWLTDPAVTDLLAEHGRAFCIAHDDEPIDDIPLTSTTDWGYFRMHANAYTSAELEHWANRIRSMGEQWERVFVFFNHYDVGFEHARDLAKLLE